MNKERKSKLMLSYINDEEVEEDEEINENEENNSGKDNSLDNKIDLEKPLIVDENNIDSRHSRNSRNSIGSNNSNKGARPKFTGEKAEDKQMLYDMGFKFNLINTIYNNMHPADLQEALDYLNKNDQGKFTHSYIENERFICAICSQARNAHENTALFLDDLNLNTNANRNTNTTNNALNSINTRGNINSVSTPGNSTRNSNRYNRLENSYLNSIKKTNNNYNYSYNKPMECGVCGDTIEYQDQYKVKISCNHSFCLDCWENYLKEKINNANVAKISCMQHGCSVVLSKEFIRKILNNDDIYMKKYDKFEERQKLLMSDKNIKFCPTPDCDGYAERKNKNIKYVKCNFGHDFCFECLNAPHGDKKCEELIDKGFEDWKSHKIVKRCPKCKMWTEKNEGCNHMTCVECKFQWCWLCQKEYKYGHYNYGSCKGLQFEKEQDEEKIKAMLERNAKLYPNPPATTYNYSGYNPHPLRPLRRRRGKCYILKEIFIFLLFLIIYPYVFFFRIADHDYYLDDCYIVTYMASVIPVFVCFEILFFSLNVIFVIPGFLLCNYYRELYRFTKREICNEY